VPETPPLRFDLIVATVGRTSEPDLLLHSLARQTYRAFRVVVVDQNDDDRLAPVLARHGGELEIDWVRSARGLSRARNTGLAVVRAELVGFPDDDCSYPDDLLDRVNRRFAERPELDGVTGRTTDASGRSSARWGAARRALDRESVWHGGNSATTFLRRGVVGRVGTFDESLGLGSETAWSSGEDTDYLTRALDLGARIEYDPDVVVFHELRPATDPAALGGREGAAVGYLLGKHRYAGRTVASMLVRPLGGVLVSLARRDLGLARFHASTLHGRIRGYRAGRAV
jgi:glycosyltransferase involved in cell wall biosynthesis